MLTQERLKELLSYDPETGEFRWLVQRGYVAKGSVAGSGKVYRYIQVDNRTYLAHRLAWFYTQGVWPTGELDHADLTKTNNHFSNLREASLSENRRNVGIRSNNTSGYRGVDFHKAIGKFRARATLNGKVIHLGSFTTAELASEAYQAFAKANHGEFYRGCK